jgi:hypothetical protein
MTLTLEIYSDPEAIQSIGDSLKTEEAGCDGPCCKGHEEKDRKTVCDKCSIDGKC